MTTVGGPRAGDETTAHPGGEAVAGGTDDAMLLWEAVREAARHESPGVTPGPRSAAWGPVHPGFAGLPMTGGMGIGADPPEVEWLAAAVEATRPRPEESPLATFRGPRATAERGGDATAGMPTWTTSGASRAADVDGLGGEIADDAAQLHAALMAPGEAGPEASAASALDGLAPGDGEVAGEMARAVAGAEASARAIHGDEPGEAVATEAVPPESMAVRQRDGESHEAVWAPPYADAEDPQVNPRLTPLARDVPGPVRSGEAGEPAPTSGEAMAVRQRDGEIPPTGAPSLWSPTVGDPGLSVTSAATPAATPPVTPAVPAPREGESRKRGSGDSLRGVARGGVANLAGSAVSGAAGLGITWLVAAALGPAGAGLFFAATSAFLITTSLSRLGTPTGLVYWIARLRSDGVTSIRRTLRIALTPVVLVSCTLGVAGYLLAPALAGAYSPDPAHTAEYARLLRLLALFVPAATILDVLLAATRGLSTMKPTVYIERLGRTLLQVALLGFAVVLAGDGGAAGAVTIAWAVPFVPAVAAAALWLRKRRGPATGEGPAPREFWTYTGPRALGSLAQLALQRLDILLVAGMLGFGEAALYTVATRFVIAGQLANLAVGSSLQPRIAAALSPKNGAMRDPDTARRLYRHTTSWIILLAWPMYLTAAVLAPQYLRLFGAEYDTPQAVVIVRVMAAAMLVASACGTVDSVLSMSGRTSWQLSNVLAALAANIAVDLWLIPRVGVAGAALGWAAAVLANNLIPLAQLGIAERLHPFGRESGLAMGLAALCFGALPVAAIALGAPGVPAAVGGGLVYALALWRLRGPLLTKHVRA